MIYEFDMFVSERIFQQGVKRWNSGEAIFHFCFKACTRQKFHELLPEYFEAIFVDFNLVLYFLFISCKSQIFAQVRFRFIRCLAVDWSWLETTWATLKRSNEKKWSNKQKEQIKTTKWINKELFGPCFKILQIRLTIPQKWVWLGVDILYHIVFNSLRRWHLQTRVSKILISFHSCCSLNLWM